MTASSPTSAAIIFWLRLTIIASSISIAGIFRATPQGCCSDLEGVFEPHVHRKREPYRPPGLIGNGSGRSLVAPALEGGGHFPDLRAVDPSRAGRRAIARPDADAAVRRSHRPYGRRRPP